MESTSTDLSLGQLATLACVLEVSIPKPGNVHRGADFADTTINDFLISAVAIAPAMDVAATTPLGETVLRAVRDTRRLINVNTNLGIILLLSPLAAVSHVDSDSIRQFLANTGPGDAAQVYEAIAMCSPGGLGRAAQHDVRSEETPDSIVAAMQLAAARDMVAAQYCNGFDEVLGFVLPAIRQAQEGGHNLVEAVIHAHIQTMHQYPDSLIARKNGSELAAQSAAMAGNVLSSGEPFGEDYMAALADLDFWLRADGNRRNPGTTADLIAAALFAGLRLNQISLG
ncbi:MAG: triphosphoribosyl-dephospho-CoA synthase [Pirellulaceae bacterium]